jgi:translation initiation factor 6
LTLARISIYGNPNVGAFTFATDKFVLVPPDTPKSTLDVISSTFQVPVHKAMVGGSVLLGIFLAGNSNGLILPNIVTEEEYSALEKSVPVPLAVYEGKKNALGNMALINDSMAMVGPEAEKDFKDLVESHLKVCVATGRIAGLNMPGVCAAINGKGIVSHPLTTEEESAALGEIFNIPVDISTVNCGFPYVRVGLTANSCGAVVGEATTGPEMVRIDSSLGLSG